MMRDEYYKALRKSQDELQHDSLGEERRNHRYIDRKIVNGKIQYIYPEDKLSFDKHKTRDDSHLERDKRKSKDTSSKRKSKNIKSSVDKKKEKKSKKLEKIADDVILGKYGNGEERKKELGDNYDKVQRLVNEKLLGKEAADRIAAKREKETDKKKVKVKVSEAVKSKKVNHGKRAAAVCRKKKVHKINEPLVLIGVERLESIFDISKNNMR